jgi:hypothetical protein
MEKLDEQTVVGLATLGVEPSDVVEIAHRGDVGDEDDESEKTAWPVAQKSGLDAVAVKAALRPIVVKVLHMFVGDLAALDARLDSLDRQLIRVKRLHL